MARVTVEDCVKKIPNRFDLVMLAAQRSRDISAGSDLTIERDNDKNPVVSLREIAEETVPLSELGQSLVRGMQKFADIDEPEEEELVEILAGSSGETIDEGEDAPNVDGTELPSNIRFEDVVLNSDD